MRLSRLRRSLYRAGSALGDIQAATSGSPARIGRRIASKMIWRGFGRLMRMLMRGR